MRNAQCIMHNASCIIQEPVPRSGNRFLSLRIAHYLNLFHLFSKKARRGGKKVDYTNEGRRSTGRPGVRTWEGGTRMEDETIVKLLLARDDSALGQIERKYGAYIGSVSLSILRDLRDTEEVKNDVLGERPAAGAAQSESLPLHPHPPHFPQQTQAKASARQ